MTSETSEIYYQPKKIKKKNEKGKERKRASKVRLSGGWLSSVGQTGDHRAPSSSDPVKAQASFGESRSLMLTAGHHPVVGPTLRLPAVAPD